MMDVIVYSNLRKYIQDCLVGMGALKGASCQMSIEPITGGNRLNFIWVDNNDVTHTDHIDVMNGEDGTDGDDGLDGVSPTITVKKSTDNSYILTITDKNGSFDTPNLKGGGGGGGATELADLSDILLSELLAGDILKFDGEKWVNESTASGSLVSAVLTKDTMPTAGEELDHIAVLYVGETTANYTKGHIYLCSEVNSAYTWVELTQGGSGATSVDDWSQDIPFVVQTPKTGSYYYEEVNFTRKIAPNTTTIYKTSLPRNSGNMLHMYVRALGGKGSLGEITNYPANSSIRISDTEHYIIITNNTANTYTFNLQLVGNGTGYASNDSVVYCKNCNLNDADKAALIASLDGNEKAHFYTIND